jgi:hypothetical protein
MYMPAPLLWTFSSTCSSSYHHIPCGHPSFLCLRFNCAVSRSLKSNMQGTDGHIWSIGIAFVNTHCFQLTSSMWSFHYSSLNTTDSTHMSNVPTWPTQQIHALLHYYIFTYNMNTVHSFHTWRIFWGVQNC